VLDLAEHLIKRQPLRTLDAIQFACAQRAAKLLALPMIFVTSDSNLLSAAAAEGWTIDNPNNHP
jgi:predicted nucleic acid-binding protein